jgi:ABC-2 type transport system permease protein
MKKYWVAFKIGWEDAFEYRMEVFLSMAGWIVRLMTAIFIWAAVFNGKEMIGDYTFESIVIYFIITSIVTTLVFSRVGFYVGEDIHTGDFSNYLTRPISYVIYKIVSEFSTNILRAIIGAAVFLTILFFTYPGFFSQFEIIKIAPILVMLLFAYIINCLITTIIGLSGFWVVNSNRLMFVYFAIITGLSGMTIPLDLFPKKIYDMFFYLPFSYSFFFPVKIIQTKHLDPVFLGKVLFGQIIFTLILILLTKLVFRLGVKKYEAVGR